MAQQWQYNDNVLYGQVVKSGDTIETIAAVLYKEDSTGALVQVDYTNTDYDGNWAFGITETGWYTVKFFGGGLKKEDWISRIYLEYDPQSFESQYALVYSMEPTMSVSESHSRIDVNKNEISVIDFSFSMIQPDAGKLARIDVLFKRPGNIDWDFFKSFPITDDTLTSYVGRGEIMLEEKPEYYDFRAIFVNPINEPYSSGGSVYTSDAYNVKLDGVPDVTEYVEVVDLRAINTDDTESGVLKDDVIKMEWTDLKTLEKSAFPIQSKDAFGRAYEITYEVSRKLEDYVVYMFVADSNVNPQKRYPGAVATYGFPAYGSMPWAYKGEYKGDPNGLWVFVGHTSAPSFETKVPRGKYVGFWVGFRTQKTSTKIVSDTYPH